MAEISEKNKKMKPDEVKRFFDFLPSFYRDIAMTQFYMVGRIGETVGILTKNIDLEKRILRVKEILIWVKGRPTIKCVPKNGKERQVYINDALLEIIRRKLEEVPPNCPFLFHDNGKPLLYNMIRANYRKALVEAGLDQYSVTHVLHHSMAVTTRMITGSIDNVQAVTGYSSVKMAEHYGSLTSNLLNKKSLEEVEDFMGKI